MAVPVKLHYIRLCKGDLNAGRGALLGESPDDGPEGWGYRVALTFLFPK